MVFQGTVTRKHDERYSGSLYFLLQTMWIKNWHQKFNFENSSYCCSLFSCSPKQAINFNVVEFCFLSVYPYWCYFIYWEWCSCKYSMLFKITVLSNIEKFDMHVFIINGVCVVKTLGYITNIYLLERDWARYFIYWFMLQMSVTT